MKKPNLLISECLCGVHCRYDGKTNRIDELECIQSLYNIIPICPEILGGLSTPRPPAERVGQFVINNIGVDVTKEFVRGALRTLTIAQDNNCHRALLKAKSPSCGCGEIYDGTCYYRFIDRKSYRGIYREQHRFSYTEEKRRLTDSIVAFDVLFTLIYRIISKWLFT